MDGFGRSYLNPPDIHWHFFNTTTKEMKLHIALLAAIVGTANSQDTEAIAAGDGVVSLHGSGTTNPSKCKILI